MQFGRFAVGDRAYCTWEWDLRERNLEFLESLRPGYFSYLARAHEPSGDADDRQFEAIALRTAYLHGLETFFALSCATIQAAHCIVGWMHLYRTEDLVDLVRAISSYRGCRSILQLPAITWEDFARAVCTPFPTGDPKKDEWIQQGFATLWARFADDFTDESGLAEYNSIKHGLRLRPGGFMLSMGEEKIPGVAAPAEGMHVVGSSEFGSTFFLRERIEGLPRFHVRMKRHSRNWDPRNFEAGLHLLEMSIANVVAYARGLNGADWTQLQLHWPSEQQAFELPWAHHPGVMSMTMDSIVGREHVAPLTQAQILEIYTRGDGEKRVEEGDQ